MLNEYKDNINLYLERHNILFYNIPKVASSSIWSICAQMKHGYQVTQEDQVRSVEIPTIKSSALHKFPNVIKVGFVRNPFDRIVSCYRNKITKKHHGFMERNGMHESISFEEFVNHICQLPDSESDRHFRSQYTYIFDHQAQLIADYVGRFESFNQDFREIIRLYDLPKLDIPHWNKETKKPYTSYYTSNLVDKLKKRYEIDLMLFGYEYNKDLDSNKREDWKKELTSKAQIEILKCKSQKLLRLVKHKEKYDNLPKGVKGLLIRKYKQYFTDYFD